MTYKPNTYDTRESPAFEIINNLKAEGYDIEAFDSFVPGYEYDNIINITKGKDCLVVLVEHDEVRKELEDNLKDIKANMNTPIIFRPADISTN